MYKAEDVKKYVTTKQLALEAGAVINEHNQSVAFWRNGDNTTAIYYNDDDGTCHDFVRNKHYDVFSLYMEMKGYDFSTALKVLGDKYCPQENKSKPPSKNTITAEQNKTPLPTQNTISFEEAKRLNDDLQKGIEEGRYSVLPPMDYNGYTETAVYEYRYENGNLAYTKHRKERINADGKKEKTFSFCLADGKTWKEPPENQRPLYNLPNIIKKENQIIYINEGEKCADACIKRGLCGTTSGSSCGTWQTQFNAYFRGKDVIVLYDNDPNGLKYALTVSLALLGVAKSVKYLTTYTDKKGGDVADFFDNEIRDASGNMMYEKSKFDLLMKMVANAPIVTENDRARLEDQLRNINHENEPTSQKIMVHGAETLEQADRQTDWRVTMDDVKNALAGTVIGEMAEIFCSVTNPPLSLKFGLCKAINLAALCTSGRREELEEHMPLQQTEVKENVIPPQQAEIKEYGLKKQGAALARLTTSTGLLLNAYTLLVAPSSTGKDIGNLLPDMANQLGLEIDGMSAEGLQDALIKQTNGLLTISELTDYLDKKNQDVASKLTWLFDVKHFNIALSNRTKAAREGKQRETDYVAPNLAAYIQPKMLEQKASLDLVHMGLMARFFIFKVENDEIDILTSPSSINHDEAREKLMALAKQFLKKWGVVKIPEGYAAPLIQMFPQSEQTADNSYLLRLCREHSLRLLIWLSVKKGDTSPIVTITADDWNRTKILVKWFYSMAKSVIGNIDDTSEADRQEAQCVEDIRKWMENHANAFNGGTFSQSTISKIFHRKGLVTRNRALQTLEEQGFIIRTTETESNKDKNAGRKQTLYIMTAYLPTAQ